MGNGSNTPDHITGFFLLNFQPKFVFKRKKISNKINAFRDNERLIALYTLATMIFPRTRFKK